MSKSLEFMSRQASETIMAIGNGDALRKVNGASEKAATKGVEGTIRDVEDLWFVVERDLHALGPGHANGRNDLVHGFDGLIFRLFLEGGLDPRREGLPDVLGVQVKALC